MSIVLRSGGVLNYGYVLPLNTILKPKNMFKHSLIFIRMFTFLHKKWYICGGYMGQLLLFAFLYE